MNEWSFSGEVFYLKKLDDGAEFSASVKVRGFAKRPEAMSSQIAELTFLLTHKAYSDFMAMGGQVYSKATLKGHMETWIKSNKDSKIMLIADSIVDVE